MKVVLNLPPGGMATTYRAYDAQGQEVDVSRIEIEPAFFSPNGAADIGFIRCLHGRTDKELSRVVLRVMGSSGDIRVQRKPRSSVTPRAELEQQS